jgi:NhaP-type Na+/H+ or K+/H+ antiporter
MVVTKDPQLLAKQVKQIKAVAVLLGAMVQTLVLVVAQILVLAVVVVVVLAVRVTALFNGRSKKWKTKLLVLKMAW